MRLFTVASCWLVLGIVYIPTIAEAQYADHFPDSLQFFRSAAAPQPSLGAPTQEDEKQLLLKADSRTFLRVTLTVNWNF